MTPLVGDGDLAQLATLSGICAAGMEAEPPRAKPGSSIQTGWKAAPRILANPARSLKPGHQHHYTEWLKYFTKFVITLTDS